MQGVPHLQVMYMQVGDFDVSRGLITGPLTRISCNTVFSKSQNACKAGTLCVENSYGFLILKFEKRSDSYFMAKNTIRFC